MIRMGKLRPSERKEKIYEDAHMLSVTPHAARQHVLRSTMRNRRFKHWRSKARVWSMMGRVSAAMQSPRGHDGQAEAAQAETALVVHDGIPYLPTASACRVKG